jgi:hypothetical protein
MIARWLWPSQQVALLVLAAAMFVGLGVQHVSAIHAARAARHDVCAARLQALRARNRFVERFVAPADPCAAILLVGEQP